jgi:diguanylate cyclase (GGDEF)-like protein/PAS domain S-box-containing protein
MGSIRRRARVPALLWASAAALCLPAGAWAFTPPASITVTTDDNYPPYLFRAENGELQGITRDKWAIWSARTGVAVRLEGTTWARAQQAVQQGRADVLETVARTPARETLYEFSRPRGEIEARVFFHNSVSVSHHPASMTGFAVAAKEESACGRWLSDRGVAVRRYNDSEAVVRAAIAGDVRMFCMDAPIAQHLLARMRQAEDFRQTAPLYSTSLHWATRAGNAQLRDFVEAGFEKVGSAELSEIEKRWRGSRVESLVDPRYRDYIVTTLLAAVAAAGLLVAWNRTLSRRVAARTAQLRDALARSDLHAAQVSDLYNNAPCGYHSLGPDGTYLEVNDTELRWLGETREAVIGKRKFSDYLDAEGREAFRTNFARFLEQGEARDRQYELVSRDGKRTTILLSATIVRAHDGTPLKSRATLFDITERNLAEQRIAHLAQHDALTGLPNRTLLRDRLEQALAHAHRDGTQAAVLFVDLDRFKMVNDSLGHDTGDRLLQSVAERIQQSLREGDTVARHGGDEFVVVLRDVASAAAAGDVAEKILDGLGRSFRIQAHELHVTGSIGVSLYPADGSQADVLLRHADTAMYHAKQAGRANYQYFTESMNVAAMNRLGIENALRRAIANREFQLNFQPIVDLRTRATTGFEALLRWVPQGRDPIMPLEFIGIAEESRLIVPIGEWVMHEALVRAREWQAPGRPVKIAVNVSANQLARPNFAGMLRRVVRDVGIDPRLIELEVTESVIVESSGGAREAIDEVDSLGIAIVIDDFGTGYSGLTYLKRLPIDTVKIDQSFVRDLTVDPDDAAIVTAIVAMARSLGVDVVAEGVETEEQATELKRLGCQRAQGYLLGRPMSAKDASAFAGISEGLRVQAEQLG